MIAEGESRYLGRRVSGEISGRSQRQKSPLKRSRRSINGFNNDLIKFEYLEINCIKIIDM